MSQMTLTQVLDGIASVMTDAAAESGGEGHVGDADVGGVPRGWRLIVFFDFLDPTYQDSDTEWECRIATVLLRNDDSSRNDLGQTELLRAFRAFEPMYLALYKLVGDGTASPRTGTPFDGKYLVLLPDPEQQGIVADGFDDPNRITRIGAKWRIRYRGAVHPEPPGAPL